MIPNYPVLAQAALQLIEHKYRSVDAERSFSKLRNVQHPNHTSMDPNTLRMQMTLHFNQDYEGHFANYD